MGTWDLNFIQRPDAVTGLQRRSGSYITEFKSNIQERLVKEHLLDPNDAVPQTQHGVHRMGSGVSYVTEITDPVTLDPTTRPDGVTALSDDDIGRTYIKDGKDFYYWRSETDGWVKLDTTLVGTINIWGGATVPNSDWLFCQGQLLQRDTYPELFIAIGTLYGSESVNDFYLPDFRGLTAMGQGQQDIGPDDNTKGYTTAVGTVYEDRLQTIEGSIAMTEVYEQGNIVAITTGAFERIYSQGSSDLKTLDRTSRKRARSGFEINLSAGDNPVRHGAFGHASAILVNYAIKVS